MKKISIVLTNYNYNHHLKKAVKSICKQTYSNIELIIVDDASSDRDFTALHGVDCKLVKLTDSVGQAEASNIGFASATGCYFMRMDADDWLSSECLFVLAAYLEVSPKVNFAYSDYWECVEENKEYVSQNRGLPHGSCILMRASAFRYYGGYDPTLIRQEDYSLVKKMASGRDSSRYVSLPLWYYRIHEGQRSQEYNNVIQARQKLKGAHANKILAVIPARKGSKGVSGKNLITLNSISLVARAIQMVKKASIDALIVVATDDENIAKIALKENVDVVLEDTCDPSHVEGTIPATQHALAVMAEKGWAADIVVTVQATCPFTPHEALSNGLELLLLDNLDSVVCMSELTGRHPHRIYSALEEGYYAPIFPEEAELHTQRQDRSQLYQFTGGFYIRRSFLLNNYDGKFALGKNWKGVLVTQEQSVDIDTNMDVWLAESVATHMET